MYKTESKSKDYISSEDLHLVTYFKYVILKLEGPRDFSGVE